MGENQIRKLVSEAISSGLTAVDYNGADEATKKRLTALADVTGDITTLAVI